MVTCIYCGRRKETRDHVPGRALLERPYPPNLRTVPACGECNRGYSLDEEYFLTVLANIGTSKALQARIEEGGSVDRALERSPGLSRRLEGQLLVDTDGRPVIEPELDRVHRVLLKTAAGLFFLRYGFAIPVQELRVIGAFPFNIRDQRPSDLFVAIYTSTFRQKPWSTLQKGVFSYIVVRPFRGRRLCIMNFHDTLWGVVEYPSRRRSPRRRSDPNQLSIPK